MRWESAALVAMLATALVDCKKSSSDIAPVPAVSGTSPSIPVPGAAEPSSKVASWLVGDVREGKWDLAYSIMSSSYRASVSRDEFERRLRAHPYFFEPKSIEVYKSGSRGSTGYVTGVFESSSGSYEAEYSMVLEGGEWRIASLRVGGSEVLPAFASPPAPKGAPHK